MRRTVISSLVRVPVLSEQMTDVLPSVSTTGKRRTKACRRTIRWTPIASEMVTTAGSASGTTATARATPKDQHLQQRLAAPQAQEHDHTHDGERRVRQLAADAVQVLLQRRPAGLDRLQQLGDLAELGLHAGGHDHGAAAAVSHRRPGKSQVAAVAQREPHGPSTERSVSRPPPTRPSARLRRS